MPLLIFTAIALAASPAAVANDPIAPRVHAEIMVEVERLRVLIAAIQADCIEAGHPPSTCRPDGGITPTKDN